MADGKTEPLWHAIRRNLHVLVIASLIVLVLETSGCLKPIETPAIDRMLRVSVSEPSKNLVIVQIDQQDYETLFDGSSPLQPLRLKEIIRSIQRGGASVIGVDVDTSDGGFAETDWPTGNVVWARAGHPDDRSMDKTSDSAATDLAIIRQDFLGGNFVETKNREGEVSTMPPSGMPLFAVDSDGVVRRYRRMFFSSEQTSSSEKDGYTDSLPLAVLSAACSTGNLEALDDHGFCSHLESTREHARHGGHDLILNFSGDQYSFQRIPTRVVLESAKEPWWPERSPLKDKIVLLGGVYRQSRDIHATPVGPRLGIELVAQAIESELSGGGIRHTNHALAIALDLVAGLAFIWMNWKISIRYNLYLSFLFIVTVSLLASFVCFYTAGYWFSFVAVLISLWIHMLWDKARENRHERQELEEEIAAYQGKYGMLDAELNQ